MKTSCKDCIFAIFDDYSRVGVGKTQKGCEFGRLDKFNKTLIREEDIDYYLIDGFCNRCTHTKYLDKMTDPFEETKIRTRVRVQLFFNLKSLDPDYIRKVCSLLSPLYFPPASIHYLNGTGIHNRELINTINEFSTTLYRITSYDPEELYSDILFPLLNRERSDFFMVTDNPNIPHHMIYNLDQAFNEDLIQIGVFKYKGFKAYSTAIGKHFYQTGELDHYDDIEQLVKEQNPELICTM